MRDLFPSYRGDFLEVSHMTHEVLSRTFPEVDLPSVYREAEAHIFKIPPRQRPKNIRRFLVNWCKKEKRYAARNEGIEAELRVGVGPLD